jgi:GntR family transcriptional regulator
LRPGVSIYEQIIYAAKKAIISGQIRPGDPFASVPVLSQELKIKSQHRAQSRDHTRRFRLT